MKTYYGFIGKEEEYEKALDAVFEKHDQIRSVLGEHENLIDELDELLGEVFRIDSEMVHPLFR